jgi:acylphosphatase
VTALVGGPEAAVARMLELFRTGPRAAVVTGVTTKAAEPADLPPDFRQAR